MTSDSHRFEHLCFDGLDFDGLCFDNFCVDGLCFDNLCLPDFHFAESRSAAACLEPNPHARYPHRSSHKTALYPH